MLLDILGLLAALFVCYENHRNIGTITIAIVWRESSLSNGNTLTEGEGSDRLCSSIC
jgi:hypothetical protein